MFRESTGTGVILASNRFAGNLDTTQLRSISVDGRRFRELPFSDVEVKAVAAEFSKQGLPSLTFTNESASEENFKQQAPLCSYLHVATHGFVNARDPGRSALLFAQPSDTTGGEDGVLYAAEAYNLHLNADLVVLSSCESGVGRFVNGEGVYALMRGFMYSGARNIIYSLWQVMDNHTSELMKLFYEGVLSGSRFAKALQMAEIQMLSKRTNGLSVLLGRVRSRWTVTAQAMSGRRTCLCGAGFLLRRSSSSTIPSAANPGERTRSCRSGMSGSSAAGLSRMAISNGG